MTAGCVSYSRGKSSAGTLASRRRWGSFIPAIINTLTVQYRIRTLLILWGKMEIGPDMNALLAFIGDPPAWEHVVVLVAYTLVVLAAAIGVVRSREFSTAEEGEG